MILIEVNLFSEEARLPTKRSFTTEKDCKYFGLILFNLGFFKFSNVRNACCRTVLLLVLKPVEA